MEKSKKKVEEHKPNRHDRRMGEKFNRLSTKNLMGKFKANNKVSHRRTPEQESRFRKAKNVLKHIRISQKATGYEAYVHKVKAVKLFKKYGYENK